MTLQRTKQWFELAVPTPTERNKVVQLAVHLEEALEMLDSINIPEKVELFDEVRRMLLLLSNAMKKDTSVTVVVKDPLELLDSLVDQIVTATGVAHMNGFDIIGALQEVNSSNFSKFVDDLPIFDENGKIKKGPNYFKPDLTKFV